MFSDWIMALMEQLRSWEPVRIITISGRTPAAAAAGGRLVAWTAGILCASLCLQQLWRVIIWGRSRGMKGSTAAAGRMRLPPGSLGLPLIGETLEMLAARGRAGGAWGFVERRLAKHGDVFKTSLLGRPTVVLTGPAAHKALFTGENRIVRVSWPRSVPAVLGPRSLVALSSADHDAMRIRRAFMTFLRPEALQRYTTQTDRLTRAFLLDHWEGKSQLKVYPLMKQFTFSLACELLMSRSHKEEQVLLEEPFTTMMKGLLNLPIPLPGTRFSKAIAASKVLRDHFQTWINERRSNLAQGIASNDQDLLSCLLAFKDNDGKLLTDEDIKDNILLLLFAGHDTSTVVATMMCKFLAENPTILEEVWQENKEIATRKGPHEPLNWMDLQCMKLSWRVVQETLRLQPPAQGVFRMAIEDFEHKGYRIPKSWRIYWSANSTHRDPKYFPNPSKFDPSRFDGVGPTPYTFVPFGGGPRMCPGNEFVRMEILIFLHHLVNRFTWSLIDPLEKILVDPMPCPEKGLPIYLKPRILH